MYLTHLKFSLNVFLYLKQVPGRMGMLVTVFLIQTGIYGSVQAPRFRGLGFLEKWYIGMQVPIMFAIAEYGIILILMKYKGYEKDIKIGKKTFTLEKFMKVVDLISFFFSFIACMIFKVSYLCMCIREYNKQ